MYDDARHLPWLGIRVLHLHGIWICLLEPTSHSKMQSNQTLSAWSQHASAVIEFEAHDCSGILSCSLSYCICIVFALVSTYSHILLTPLSNQSIVKSLPQTAICTRTSPSALPCSSKAQETAAHMRAARGREKWDWMGKQETEGRGGGILWEGSQSNYRQRCSPGFFGGTKFTFQQTRPPSTNTFFLLLLSLPLPGSGFLIFFSCWLTFTPPNSAPLRSQSVCLSWLPERGRGMEVYHQQSFKSCHPIAVSC